MKERNRDQAWRMIVSSTNVDQHRPTSDNIWMPTRHGNIEGWRSEAIGFLARPGGVMPRHDMDFFEFCQIILNFMTSEFKVSSMSDRMSQFESKGLCIILHFFQICSDISGSFQIYSDIFRYFRIFCDLSTYFEIYWNTSRFIWIYLLVLTQN